jgi:probable F420-dependent oxidoreductase
MRFGFGLLTAQHHPADPRPVASLYREVVEYAALADKAGFDSYWTSEHHFLDDGWMPSQLLVLAAIASRTEQIRLGTAVLLAPLHDPLRVAEDAATVDLISGGRLVLGLGLGWRDEEFEVFRIAKRSRASRLEGAVTVLRQAWGDGLVTGDGRHFSYPEPGPNVTPKPVRGASTPIWLGGGAEAAVRRAGRIADGFIASGRSPAEMATFAAWITEEAEASRRDPATIELGLHQMVFPWRGGDAWERVAEHARYLAWKYQQSGGARGSRERRLPAPGEPPTTAEMRSRVIAGSPEEVADSVRAYAGALGRSGLFVFRAHFPGLDPAVQRESFDILVEDVLPLLRD